MSVLRWTLTDPYDTNASTNHYTFVRNPSSMTSIGLERSITSMTTSQNKILIREGTTPAKSWEFSGAILHKDEYENLRRWVYTKKRRIYLTDHFGRRITLIFQTFEAVPKKRIGYYWSHDYTITSLLLGVTAPTVLEGGPV